MSGFYIIADMSAALNRLIAWSFEYVRAVSLVVVVPHRAAAGPRGGRGGGVGLGHVDGAGVVAVRLGR